ncbi:MAG: phytanoyl-CoA dioxygenase family protein [Flavobacteriales bacterium]|nr:phytanoyl-CoA dioxygenase family protein [Flavobacteriales bacterium]
MTLTPTTDFHVNQELELLGYSVIPFLNKEACAELSEIYTRHSSKTDSGFFCTMFSKSEDERRFVDAGLKKILRPQLERLFPNHEPLFGNFMVKEPGAQSDWPVHQDWTYVDETVSDSFAIWIPLMDLNRLRGHLCVVPGSHKIRNLVRGPGVTDPFRHLHRLIREQLNFPLEMKAGEAIIWNHRTVHFSNPNLSEQTRVAATVILVPKGVETFHFWKDSSAEQTSIEQFAVDSEFFSRNDIFKRPEGVGLVGTHRDDFPDVSEQEMRTCFEYALQTNNEYGHLRLSKKSLSISMSNKKYRSILKDASLDAQFRKDGYVIVDFMDSDQVDKLIEIVDELRNDINSSDFSTETGYKLSFFNASEAFRKKVFDRISVFCQPFINQHLCSYEPLMINTFDKEPGTGEVPVHQNWTFVDEEVFRSVSVWIPLVDVTRDNGTMEIVPRTHLDVSATRGPLIPWAFSELVDSIKERYMTPLNLSLGQAAIIDDAIIHYTSQNDTNAVRSAVQIIAKPTEATAIHYHLPSDTSEHLEVFEVDSGFFQRFSMYSRPEGVPKIAEIPYGYRPLVKSTLDRLVLSDS